MANWKNKIVSTGSKKANEFVANPSNWRKHTLFQLETLKGILGEVGWVQGVIVNKTTGNLIDGHARVEEALKANPDSLVPYVEVELTPDEELKVLLTFDPVKNMAGEDAEALRALLDKVTYENKNLGSLADDLSKKIKIYEGEIVNQTEFSKDIFIVVCPKCGQEFDLRNLSKKV